MLQKAVKSLLLLHALLASNYALLPVSEWGLLDSLLFAFVLVEVGEVCLKLCAQVSM